MRGNPQVRLSAVVVLALAAGGCSSIDWMQSADAETMRSANPEVLRSADSVYMHAPSRMKMAGGVPPGAKPGECYARVQTPAVYSTESKNVLKRSASQDIDIVPARYAEVDKVVLVKEASTRLEAVPATYEWVEERVMVRPATTRTEEVPATFETVTEQVIDTPAQMVWKVGTSTPIQKVDPATGEILCLVEIPATYKTITKQVLKSPATVRTIDVPAEYQMVKRQVVKTPATTRTVEIPAEYKSVKVTELVEEAREVRKPIPAEYQTVSNQVLVRPAGIEWREILCANNTDQATVQSIQRALKAAGFDPVHTDGVITRDMFDALNRYQVANGLPVDRDRYINIKTVEALGI